ncbi:hypothetical protein SRABI128_05175 [Microbacterium sp. Bi128]|nr:hypothetical protein SRABI128_05175 [Microbacterium sp. Bi128]
MADRAHQAAGVVDAGHQILQAFAAREVPHRAVAAHQINGVVLVGINDVDAGSVVEAGARGLVLREGDLDGIF